MAWVDANTKLYFPAVLNLEAASPGWNGEIKNVVHYKRNGVEYTDTYSMGYTGKTGEWLAFSGDKPRVQYQLTEGRNGWGIRTSSGWEEGLDELVYVTFPENPENYAGTAWRLANYIELGAYWENEVEETTPTEITYNGVATSLETGQTATLACAGKKAVTDIVVAFGGAGNITYNGTETAVDAGQTATMECAGKKMLSDVVIAMQ